MVCTPLGMFSVAHTGSDPCSTRIPFAFSAFPAVSALDRQLTIFVSPRPCLFVFLAFSTHQNRKAKKIIAEGLHLLLCAVRFTVCSLRAGRGRYLPTASYFRPVALPAAPRCRLLLLSCSYSGCTAGSWLHRWPLDVLFHYILFSTG